MNMTISQKLLENLVQTFSYLYFLKNDWYKLQLSKMWGWIKRILLCKKPSYKKWRTKTEKYIIIYQMYLPV